MSFPSGGETLAAWHLAGEGADFTAEDAAGEGRRPCVVMAHGIGGTRDSGLLPFAEAFAEAGLDALLFDYRSFGDSTGEPRQQGNPARHREDYRAAVAYARELDGVDPDRIVLWGTSWSGGHIVYVAADDGRIAAVISADPRPGRCPHAAGDRALRRGRPARPGRRLTGSATPPERSAGREPHMIPIAAPPGTAAAMSSDEAEPGYAAIAGPTWRNEIGARAVLHEGRNRAITRIGELNCPILIQIAEHDSIAPPAQAKAAAWRAKGRSEVREYPCAHFDIYVGRWRERAIEDQLHFLRRHLASRP